MVTIPIIHLGKRREALPGSGEAYKKRVISYLEARGYYVIQDSIVEGSLPDAILKRKDENKEYWLESKGTIVSINGTDFLDEMSRYLSSYLKRDKDNRFNFILAIVDYRTPDIFEAIFDNLDEEEILRYIKKLGEINEELVSIIRDVESLESISFFKNTEVIRARYDDLSIAIEKIISPAPIKPKLSDAEYASMVMTRYKDKKPIIAEDILTSNLIKVILPEHIMVGECKYRDIKNIFQDYYGVKFPLFRKVSNKIYSFSDIKNNILYNICYEDTIKKINISEWDNTIDTRNIILYLLYRWMESLCYNKYLGFNDRTEAYYFTNQRANAGRKSIIWNPRGRKVRRDVVIPMKIEDRVNFWSHRAVEIAVIKLWETYFIKLNPRWLFSSDGVNLFDGEITDRLDRSYRKSNFNRNMNQFNDFLFWHQYFFQLGGYVLQNYSDINEISINVGDIVTTIVDVKPDIEDTGEEETEFRFSLEDFFEEDE